MKALKHLHVVDIILAVCALAAALIQFFVGR